MAMRPIRLRTLMIAVAAAGLVLGIEAASRGMEPTERRDLIVASCVIAMVAVPFAASLPSSRLWEPAPVPPVADRGAELLLELCCAADPGPGRPPRGDPPG